MYINVYKVIFHTCLSYFLLLLIRHSFMYSLKLKPYLNYMLIKQYIILLFLI